MPLPGLSKWHSCSIMSLHSGCLVLEESSCELWEFYSLYTPSCSLSLLIELYSTHQWFCIENIIKGNLFLCIALCSPGLLFANFSPLYWKSCFAVPKYETFFKINFVHFYSCLQWKSKSALSYSIIASSRYSEITSFWMLSNLS